MAAAKSGRRTTYVALLRGINLGARNRVAMADLRTLVARLDAEDVRTYLQSGNVVFRSRTGRDRLRKALEDGIRDELGVDLVVVLRTKAELAKVVRANPFAAEAAEPLKVHVAFLAATPERARIRAIDPESFAPDQLQVVGREAYVHTPKGFGRSRLSNAFLERQLGVAATMRNWRTVTSLLELAEFP